MTDRGLGKGRRDRPSRAAFPSLELPRATRRVTVRALVPVYLSAIVGLPLALATAPAFLASSLFGRLVGLTAAPAIFAVAYVAVAGALSRLTLRAMIAGTFPRDLGHPVYGPRRLHALCWTAIYYCTPLYHAVLAIPFLKWLTFRLFGYRGSLDVTLYPDTWLRDLPLLRVAEGAYLSNRCTIGTNMCLHDGTVLVAPISVGKGAMVGHLAMIAPGVVLGDGVEVGVGCGVGLGASVGRKARLGPMCGVSHGAVIGERCDIGTMALIGTKAVIHPGVRIPPGIVIPPRMTIRTEADLSSLARHRATVLPERPGSFAMDVSNR